MVKDDGSALEEVYAHSDLPINKFVDYNIRMFPEWHQRQ